MISDELQAMQIEAFEMQCEFSSNTLSFHGLEATVISAPIGTSRTLQKAGYLPALSSSVEMKRSEFDRLRIEDRSVVRLDGVELQVALTSPDDGDALINFTLAPAAAIAEAEAS